MARTLDEILLELVQTIDDAMEDGLDAKAITAAFESMEPTEEWQEYQRRTINMDLRRYFSAQSDKERENIRGAMQRTMYERGKWLQKSNRKLQ